MKPRVYTASKLYYADVWRTLRAVWTDITFTARWLDGVLDRIDNDIALAKTFWKEDELDIQSSEFVLVYGCKGDKLRGALVEVGMGIALGKIIIVVGNHPDYGTWQWHEQVYHATSLTEARLLIINLFSKTREE